MAVYGRPAAGGGGGGPATQLQFDGALLALGAAPASGQVVTRAGSDLIGSRYIGPGNILTAWSSGYLQSAAAVGGGTSLFMFPALNGAVPANVVTSALSFRRDVTLGNLRLWYRQLGVTDLGAGVFIIESPTVNLEVPLPNPGGGAFLDIALDEGLIAAGEPIAIYGVWNESTVDGAIVQALLTMEINPDV